MSIATAIQNAQQKVANAYTAISNKGGTLPATQNLSNMPTAIDSIPSGGGQEEIVTAMNKTGSVINTGDKVWLNQESGYSYNFDVVGALAVNDETSVISNFSTTNYLQLQTPFNPSSSSWEVLCKFTTANVTTQQNIFKSGISAPAAAGRLGAGFEIYQSHFRISVSSNGTSWNIAHDLAGSYTVLANTTYWVKLGWSGTQYYLEYSTDGETFTRDITVSSSTAVYNNLGVTLLGLNWWDNAYQAPFLGTIDLSGTKITVGGSDWWVPSITKISDWTAVNFEKQNFSYDLDINGSPTINYGVVSNFSSSNYLSKSTAPSSWNISDYTFYCKFNSTSASSSQVIVIGSVILNTASGYCRTVVGSTNTNLFRISSNQTYWVKVVVSGTTRTFYYSTDGVAYIQCYTGTFTASTFNISKVGQNAGTYLYGNIDLNGMYLKNTSDKTVWYAMTDNSLTGVAKENIAVNAAGNVGVGMLIDEKYGVTVNDFLGDVDANGVLQAPTEEINLVFSGVKDLGNFALYGAFYTTNTSPRNVKTVSFIDLETISGSSAMYNAFYSCKNLTSVLFQKLKVISGSTAMNYAFDTCTGLTSIAMDELTTISSSSPVNRCFNNCTSLAIASFRKLTILTGNSALQAFFRGCSAISDIYFNGLTTTSFGSYINQFGNMMQNTGSKTTHRIHFPSNLQSTIAGLTGYPLFGGTSGYVTLLFDLAATS